MKKLLKNKKVQSLLMLLAEIILVSAICILISGIPLRGVPEMKEIDKIEISSEEFKGQQKEFQENYKIAIAHALFDDARYSIFPKTNLYTTNAITVTFYVGEKKYTGVINEEAVIWQGKLYALKKEPETLTAAKEYYFK